MVRFRFGNTKKTVKQLGKVVNCAGPKVLSHCSVAFAKHKRSYRLNGWAVSTKTPQDHSARKSSNTRKGVMDCPRRPPVKTTQGEPSHSKARFQSRWCLAGVRAPFCRAPNRRANVRLAYHMRINKNETCQKSCVTGPTRIINWCCSNRRPFFLRLPKS